MLVAKTGSWPGWRSSDPIIAPASIAPPGFMLTVIAGGSMCSTPSETIRTTMNGRPCSGGDLGGDMRFHVDRMGAMRAAERALVVDAGDHAAVGEEGADARIGQRRLSASRQAGSVSASIAPVSRSPMIQSPIARPSCSAPVRPKLAMAQASARLRFEQPFERLRDAAAGNHMDARLRDDARLALEAGRDQQRLLRHATCPR